MNPRDIDPYPHGVQVVTKKAPVKSLFDLELENAKRYFGNDFPGDEGLNCQKCGAAVNLGWQHIAWHESRA